MTSSPVQAAHDHAAAGRVSEALATLTAAGDAGDAVALAELAVWHLRNDIVPRDLEAARAYLARARTIGHVDAALMEVALTANGSGAPADWRGARTLLEQAARTDPVAAQHLALLATMAIDADGNPTALPRPERLSDSPRVQRFPGFCTPIEAAYLASVVAETLEPSAVVDPASGKLIAHPIRTSDSAAIGIAQESLVVQAITCRIAAATATRVTQGEPLTVLRYAPGQEYRPHLDTLPGEANQRIVTAILYLNQGYAGGETQFPLLDLAISGRAGDLLVFDNVDAAGAADPRSRHAGLPIIQGNKWIATRWIRAEPIDLWNISAG